MTSQSPDDTAAPDAKRTERVCLETATHLIRGSITLPLHGYRARFSDYLNREDIGYISLTDAERVPFNGEGATKHSFLAVAGDAVLFGYPTEGEDS